MKHFQIKTDGSYEQVYAATIEALGRGCRHGTSGWSKRVAASGGEKPPDFIWRYLFCDDDGIEYHGVLYSPEDGFETIQFDDFVTQTTSEPPSISELF